MNAFLSGAILTTSWVIGLFFLRFWLSTRDGFFLFFALSFWIFGTSHLVLLLSGSRDGPAEYYLLRVVAYSLIVAAILRKNRKRKVAEPAESVPPR